MGSKVDNIYTVGVGSLQMVPEPCPSLGKNKTMRSMDSKVDNIYTVGAGSLHLQRCLTYYILAPHTASLPIPSDFHLERVRERERES